MEHQKHSKDKKAQMTQGLRTTAPSFQDGGSIFGIIEPEIAPFDPPTPKTLA